jgi:hypothetical protein
LSKIVNSFTNKGFCLADQFLNTDDCNGEISNIDFILGSSSSYCLKETHIQFGFDKITSKNIPSVYSLTNAGILLMGNVDQILKNPEYLTPCSQASNAPVPIDDFQMISCIANDSILSNTSLECQNSVGEGIKESEDGVNVVNQHKDVKDFKREKSADHIKIKNVNKRCFQNKSPALIKIPANEKKESLIVNKLQNKSTLGKCKFKMKQSLAKKQKAKKASNHDVY